MQKLIILIPFLLFSFFAQAQQGQGKDSLDSLKEFRQKVFNVVEKTGRSIKTDVSLEKMNLEIGELNTFFNMYGSSENKLLEDARQMFSGLALEAQLFNYRYRANIDITIKQNSTAKVLLWDCDKLLSSDPSDPQFAEDFASLKKRLKKLNAKIAFKETDSKRLLQNVPAFTELLSNFTFIYQNDVPSSFKFVIGDAVITDQNFGKVDFHKLKAKWEQKNYSL